MNNNVLKLSAVALAITLSFSARAQDDEPVSEAPPGFWDSVNVNMESQLTMGASWRVQHRDRALVGIGNGGTAFSTNGDDGNLAFDRGLVASAFKLTSDLDVSRGNYGAFVRASMLYDPTLASKNYYDDADYGPGRSATLAERDGKNKAVRDHNGGDVDLLDAYVYGNFEPLGRLLTVKLGRLAVNWGEALLVTNGINSYLPADANQLRVPGFELTEVVIPFEQLYFSMSLIDRLNLEGFYQLRWSSSQPDASGSYYGTNDFAAIGGNRANLGFGRVPENTPGTTVPRAADRTPKNHGQFGFKLDYTLPILNEMNVALYAMNFHSRLPLFSGTSVLNAGANPGTADYFVEYPENIKLYGLSFNSTLPFGGLSIQGEYSLKQDQPLQVDDVELLLAGQCLTSLSQVGVVCDGTQRNYLRSWRRHDVQQVDVGFSKIFAPNSLLGYQQLLSFLEIGYTYADLPGDQTLRYEAPATYLPGNQAAATLFGVPRQNGGYATRDSWGYRLVARAEYFNVFGLFTLQPGISFAHDVNGTSPTPLTHFVEDRKTITPSLGVAYLQAWSGELSYSNFFGGGDRNLLSDRDVITAFVRYNF